MGGKYCSEKEKQENIVSPSFLGGEAFSCSFVETVEALAAGD